MRAKDARGRLGEELAAAHLIAQGLIVLDRNWRCDVGEVDIVARDGDALVICEVKTRSSTTLRQPAGGGDTGEGGQAPAAGRVLGARARRPPAARSASTWSGSCSVTGTREIEHVRGAVG